MSKTLPEEPKGPSFVQQIDDIIKDDDYDTSPYSEEYVLGQSDLFRQMRDSYMRIFLTSEGDGFGVQFSPIEVLHESQSLETILMEDFRGLGKDAKALPDFLRRIADQIETAIRSEKCADSV